MGRREEGGEEEDMLMEQLCGSASVGYTIENIT